MTIQQQCASRIYELLPEKKKLSFGCEVEYKTYSTIIPLARGIVTSSNKDGICINGDYWEKDRINQIIGQPLRLADILRAIDLQTNGSCPVCATNGLLYIGHYKNGKHSESAYNPKKDNILEQSDDFCEFLLEIIK
jgi:hypothetical protein